MVKNKPKKNQPMVIYINATAKTNKWSAWEKNKAKVQAKLKPRVPKKKKPTKKRKPR
tara:strand:- start:4941 stop:5111 length:171 start_codon:yes stop_codon:yes gene_type:complete